MKRFSLRTLIFMALCCDLGLFCKKLIAPAANLITDALHIPGGIGTAFSLMFLVLAALVVEQWGCASVIGAVQSALALCFGMVGSMGALAPIGYIVPGIVIDLALFFTRKSHLPTRYRAVLACALASPAASLTANAIVFHLRGPALLLYVYVATFSGVVAGLLAAELARRLEPILLKKSTKQPEESSQEA